MPNLTLDLTFTLAVIHPHPHSWSGGYVVYGEVTSPTNITWSKPITTSAGERIDASNVAVDPKDRNHFVYSKAGQYRMWESKDGGKTVTEFTNHDTGVFFVMIDNQGWLYTATQVQP